MKSLKRNYLSFVDFFFYGVLKTKPPVAPAEYSQHGYHYHEGDVLPPEKGLSRDLAISGYQLLGAFTPFYKMGKDVVNTFKPYPHREKATRDLLIGWNGYDNMNKGIVNLVGGVVTLAAWVIASPVALAGCFLPTKHKDTCRSFFTKYLSYPVSWIIEGAGNMFRALTQCLTMPLHLGIKMPMRAILNGVATHQGKKFLAEEKSSMQRLAKQVESELTNPTTEIEQDMEKIKVQNHDINSMKGSFKFHSERESVRLANNEMIEFLNGITTPIFLKEFNDKIDEKISCIESLNKKLDTEIKGKKDQNHLIITQAKNFQKLAMLDILKQETNSNKLFNKKLNFNKANLNVLLFVMHKKYNKCLKKGWHSDINDSESSTFTEYVYYKTDYHKFITAKKYLNFFLPKNIKKEELQGNCNKSYEMKKLSTLPK